MNAYSILILIMLGMATVSGAAGDTTTSTLTPPPESGRSAEDFDKMIAYFTQGHALWVKEAWKDRKAGEGPDETALGKGARYWDARNLAEAAKVKQSTLGGIVTPLPLPITRSAYRDLPASGTVTVLNEADYMIKKAPYPEPTVDRMYDTYRELASTHYRAAAKGETFRNEYLEKARAAETAYLDLLAVHKRAISQGKVIEVTPAPVLPKMAKPKTEIAGASQARKTFAINGPAAGLPTPEVPSRFVKLEDSKFSTQTFKGTWVVEFGSPYCGICKMMKPVINEIASAAPQHINFGTIDCTRSPRQSTRFNIESFPTYLLLKNGRVVDTHTGSITKAKFAEFVSQ